MFCVGSMSAGILQTCRFDKIVINTGGTVSITVVVSPLTSLMMDQRL